MSTEFNPYAPPKTAELGAPVAQDTKRPLAARWRRIVAYLLESVIVTALIVPAQYFAGTFQREMERQESGGSSIGYHPEIVLWTAVALLFMVAINWNLLANGQTIGKLLLNIRIDRVEGGPCERGRIIFRRMVVMQIFYLIPVINIVFIILDSMLMIFRNDKRTLHDMIAGTKVVDMRQTA
ncbi:MAG TPA: RDD family protein [Prosthecobacter sp.]|nr:RDD family protein [Prosthecobacter sp.]HRK17278.1 RDD family protein [Prosthecobacter sp.]